MGTWGTRVFDDDGAADIYAEYRILLGYKMEPEKAWQLIYDFFYPDYKGSDDEDIFWLSVALYQWQNGILKDEVKEKALQCIDDASYLEVWKESDPTTYKKRKAVLEQLKDKLLHEVNPPRKVAKCPPYYRTKTGFNIGEVYSYTHDNGNISYIEVVQISKKPVTKLVPELDYLSTADFALIDVWSPKQYTIEELSHIPYRKFFEGDIFHPYSLYVCDTVSVHNEETIRANMKYLGRTPRVGVTEPRFFRKSGVEPFPEHYTEYIESTFSLPCGITNEMLNATLAEFLVDETPETLNQSISSQNPSWPGAICDVLVPIVLRNVRDYLRRIWLTRYNKNFEKGYQFAVLDLPWMDKENERRLAEKCVPTDPTVQETDFGKRVVQSVEQYLDSSKG